MRPSLLAAGGLPAPRGEIRMGAEAPTPKDHIPALLRRSHCGWGPALAVSSLTPLGLDLLLLKFSHEVTGVCASTIGS